MNDHDRLVAIIDEAKMVYASDYTDHSESDYIAETLLDSGVKLPRILAGETVHTFRVKSKGIGVKDAFCDSVKFAKISLGRGDVIYIAPKVAHNYHNQHLGSTVFLTYEEAEFALRKLMEEINANR